MARNAEIVARLVKDGATKFEKCKVTSCSITQMEDYTRVNIGIDKKVKALVTEGGVTSEKEVDAVFPTVFSINGALRENEDVSAILSHLRDNPTAYPILLVGATLDVVQEKVPANTEWRNPFANNADDASVKKFDEDKIISHVVNIRLTDKAKTRVEKIEDKLLGI